MSQQRTPDHFFEHLLKETFEFLPESEVLSSKDELLERFNVLDARERFCPDDAVLFNYLNKHQIAFSELKYFSKTKMFRIRARGYEIDIPSNWLFFSEHNKKNSKTFCIKMVCDENTDELFEVFSSLFQTSIKEMSIWHSNGRSYVLYLNHVQAESKEISNWLSNYFLVELGQKKAA